MLNYFFIHSTVKIELIQLIKISIFISRSEKYLLTVLRLMSGLYSTLFNSMFICEILMNNRFCEISNVSERTLRNPQNSKSAITVCRIVDKRFSETQFFRNILTQQTEEKRMICNEKCNNIYTTQLVRFTYGTLMNCHLVEGYFLSIGRDRVREKGSNRHILLVISR